MSKDFKFLNQTPWFEIFVLTFNSFLFYFGQAKGGEFISLNNHYFVLSILAISARYGVFFLCFLIDKIYKYQMEKLKFANKDRSVKTELRKVGESESEISQTVSQI